MPKLMTINGPRSAGTPHTTLFLHLEKIDGLILTPGEHASIIYGTHLFKIDESHVEAVAKALDKGIIVK